MTGYTYITMEQTTKDTNMTTNDRVHIHNDGANYKRHKYDYE